mmetsp:Transcript_40199/g.72432  ORF Transcript_40199/g.72432 Transcript_40199/m.72432 type:complete len:218 (-) Transcript_40199:392-1045(-)
MSCKYSKHPFAIVFRYAGTVWPLVLPYCLFNISLLTALGVLKNYTDISLSILPQGHALMSLLIAYLGVSKVNLAYERYMSAQIATGHAFMILRELNQLSITLTEQYDGAEAYEWRRDTKRTIIQLIHETVATLRKEQEACCGIDTNCGLSLWTMKLRKFVQTRQESIRMTTLDIFYGSKEDDSGVNNTKPYRTMNEGYDVQSVPSAFLFHLHFCCRM